MAYFGEIGGLSLGRFAQDKEGSKSRCAPLGSPAFIVALLQIVRFQTMGRMGGNWAPTEPLFQEAATIFRKLGGCFVIISAI